MKHLTSSLFLLTSSLLPLPSYIFLLTSSILLLTSCKADLRELCYDHSNVVSVDIHFQWPQTNAPDVKGMTVLFYNVDQPSAEPVRYDFPGMEGGTVRLVKANYRVVAYNYDTETILYRGMSDIQTLEAYTRNSSIEEGTQLTRAGMPRASGTEAEPVILEPDQLWASACLDLLLRNGAEADITLIPVPCSFEVDVTITGVPNLQYSTQFGGALSGLAASVMMETGEPSDLLATQAFTAQVVGDSTLHMRFRTFGHCPHRSQGHTNPHVLTIYAVLADGSKWYYTQEVSGQMHDDVKNPEIHIDPMNPQTLEINYEIHIDIEELPVPKPIVNGSGFQPTIDGWQGVEIDVNM